MHTSAFTRPLPEDSPQKQDANIKRLAFLDLARAPVQTAYSGKRIHTAPNPELDPPKTKREWPLDMSADAALAQMQTDAAVTALEFPVITWDKQRKGPIAPAARPFLSARDFQSTHVPLTQGQLRLRRPMASHDTRQKIATKVSHSRWLKRG